MVQPLRNAVIGIALGIAAILLVALLDGAFLNFLPSVSNLRVGATSLATCFVMVELVAAFFAAGYLARQWVKGRGALLWVVLPILVAYVVAVLKAPYLYGCDPTRFLWGCAFVHSPFIIGIAASCIGYVVRKQTFGVPHVV